MNDTESKPEGETPRDPLVHLLIEGEEEINYAHPAFARQRAKNRAKLNPAEQPPTKDGDLPNDAGAQQG